MAEDELTFPVYVVPRAARTELAGRHGQAVRIRLQAPPLEGRANEALVDFLADLLGVPRRRVSILRGHRARQKWVRIEGVDAALAAGRLGL